MSNFEHPKNKNQESKSRRDIFEIIATILRATKEEIIKTHLLYHANTNYTLFTNYLNFLIEGKLIKQVTIEVPRYSNLGHRRSSRMRMRDAYIITPKGEKLEIPRHRRSSRMRMRDAYIITPKGEKLLQNIEVILTTIRNAEKEIAEKKKNEEINKQEG